MKYLHTMVRVSDLDKSLDFYCNKLGLENLGRFDIEAGRFSLVFLAAPGEGIATTSLAGTVATISGTSASAALVAGAAALLRARGDAEVDDRVWFRPGGVIEGAAPVPTVTVIEI